MPSVHMLTGENAGKTLRTTPEQAAAWIRSGDAEAVEPEKPATPEASKRRRSRKPETRKHETR